MSRIFISYRHKDPDQALANGLLQSFQEAKHQVFVDTKIEVGTRWAEEIKSQIQKSDVFVVLISQASMASDMVRQEVLWAHREQKREKSPLRILPVRVSYPGELPYDLGAYLNPIQHVVWQEAMPMQEIGGILLSSIETGGGKSPKEGEQEPEEDPAQLEQLAKAVNQGAPLPAADIRLALDTGTVKLSSPFYVRRKADEQMEAQLTLQGTTTIVKGPRQMGKSSLLARGHASVKTKQHLSWYLDFQRLDDGQLKTLTDLVKHLAAKLARECRTTLKPNDIWDDNLGAKDNLTYFVEEAVLTQGEGPIYFFLDEADRVFPYAYRNDFFGMIRAWHNLRATNEVWDRLNLIIAHATDPTAWIQDINQSPFNVGTRLSLEDFSVAQINESNRHHGEPLKQSEDIQALAQLVGGQPYLVRQALYSLTTNTWTMGELQKAATQERGPFGDHLKRLVSYLLDFPELQTALRQVLNNNSCDNEVEFQRLLAAGLIKGENRKKAAMRCQLYADYCHHHL